MRNGKRKSSSKSIIGCVSKIIGFAAANAISRKEPFPIRINSSPPHHGGDSCKATGQVGVGACGRPSLIIDKMRGGNAAQW